MTLTQLVWTAIKILIMVMFVLNLAAILTWADRRQSSMIQDRIGPNRAVIRIFGKELRLAGLLHPAADGLKFFTKEDFMPPKADKLLFMLAPILAMGMVFTLVGTIPFGDTICLHEFKVGFPNIFQGPAVPRWGECSADPKNGYFPIDLQIAPLGVGILYVFAMSGQGIIARGDRRLVERQQVQPDGRAARREPDGLVRGDAGHVARRRDDALRHRAPRRHGPLAGRARVGHLRAAAGVLPLLHGGRRREQAHPVRLAGGRERARVRLLHRVRRDEVRDVLLRRVRRGGHRVDADRDDLPRRLGAALLPSRRAHHRVRQRDSSCTCRSRTSG